MNYNIDLVLGFIINFYFISEFELTQTHGSDIQCEDEEKKVLIQTSCWSKASTLSRTSFPVLESSPIAFTMDAGQDVDLPCSVKNLGNRQLVWHHNNKVIATAETEGESSVVRIRYSWRGNIQLLRNFTIRLYKLRESDSGFYECSVKSYNSEIPILKLLHRVIIKELKGLKVKPESGFLAVLEGDKIEIQCTAMTRNHRIVWSKKEGDISRNRSSISNNVFRIINANPNDTGLYECYLNAFPDIRSSIYVRVLHPPIVETPNRMVHSGPKYSAILKCIVKGDPKPRVQWFYGKIPVPFSSIQRIYTTSNGTEHYLHIKSVREKDFGFYICMANNTLGFDLKYIELSGIPTPPMVLKLEISECHNEVTKSERAISPSRHASKCLISVTLHWMVISYSSPVIDYRIMFRNVKTNEDEVVNLTNEYKTFPWIEATIPADSDQTSGLPFIHTKSYSIQGLRNGTKYEGALRARNKFGSSQLSSVFYFSIVANTSYILQDPELVLQNEENNKEQLEFEDYDSSSARRVYSFFGNLKDLLTFALISEYIFS